MPEFRMFQIIKFGFKHKKLILISLEVLELFIRLVGTQTVIQNFYTF